MCFLLFAFGECREGSLLIGMLSSVCSGLFFGLVLVFVSCSFFCYLFCFLIRIAGVLIAVYLQD